jgi:hypothetical protein
MTICGNVVAGLFLTHLRQSANAHHVRKFGFTLNVIQFRDAGNGRPTLIGTMILMKP